MLALAEKTMKLAPNSVVVVVIDDNVGSLEFVCAALARDGVTLLTASDPQQGLDLIYRHHPQIVLTDMAMPVMSGLDLLERIMVFDPTTQVIVMSARHTPETTAAASKKGAVDWLNKPISLFVLRDRVGRRIQACLSAEPWPPRFMM